MPNTFTPQMKQVIYKVYCYHKKRKMDVNSYEHINDVNILETVAEATGIRKTTVAKIIHVANVMQAEQGFVNFTLRAGMLAARKKRILVDDYTAGVIRRKAIPAYNVKQLSVQLKDENIFYSNKEYMRLYLFTLGFVKVPYTRMLQEHDDLVSERIYYLEAMNDFRAQEKSIFYLDETKRWKFYIDTYAWCKETPSFIIVHMSGAGFLNNDQLMLKIKREFDDNASEEDFENYHWMKDVVLPNLPPNSVIVVNIPYSETLEAIAEDKPSPDTATPLIQMWMNRHNIRYEANASNSDLPEMIDNLAARAEYSLTKILKDSGHEVIHMPEKHGDMNPLAVMLHDITDVNKNVYNLKSLITSYPKNKWEEAFKHVLENEEEYYEYSYPDDLVIDEINSEVEANCDITSGNDDCNQNNS